MTDDVLSALEQDGIAIIPALVAGSQLVGMQLAFESRLRRMRWNNFDGFEKTEPFRHMVQDVLTLDQGFVDAALDPSVKGVLRAYKARVSVLLTLFAIDLTRHCSPIIARHGGRRRQKRRREVRFHPRG